METETSGVYRLEHRARVDPEFIARVAAAEAEIIDPSGQVIAVVYRLHYADLVVRLLNQARRGLHDHPAH